MASLITKEDGTTGYVAPGPEWILLGDKCYQVCQRTVTQATIIQKDDGTIEYYLPNGGVLSGTVGYTDRVIEDLELRNLILSSYLAQEDENKLTLK